jgi:transcriptional regulator with XRE-family HTH domain
MDSQLPAVEPESPMAPSAVFRQSLREARRLKRWTQQELADALAELGAKIDATAITRIERGVRSVSLDEVVLIAAALGVSPMHLFVPLDDKAPVQVAPGLVRPAADVRAWVRGQRPLRVSDDDRLFYTQAPDNDWASVIPGAHEALGDERGTRLVKFTDRETYEDFRQRASGELYRQMLKDNR